MNLNKIHLSILKFICQILAQSDKVDRPFCNIVEHLAKDMDSQKQIDMIFLKLLILSSINAYLQNYSITESKIKYITGYLIG